MVGVVAISGRGNAGPWTTGVGVSALRLEFEGGLPIGTGCRIEAGRVPAGVAFDVSGRVILGVIKNSISFVLR